MVITQQCYIICYEYQPYVKNFYVNIYINYKDDSIIDEVTSICSELNIKPYRIWIEEPFNWDRVTDIYNETTSTKIDEWWIVR